MSKVVIVYYSEHHGNTKKLIKAIQEDYQVDLIDVSHAKSMDFGGYDVVGFASGIYMSQYHESMFELLDVQKTFPAKAFFVCTSGSGNAKYADPFIEKATACGMASMGVYACKGFDTYGIFKLFGGIAKGHPTQQDIEQYKHFFKTAVMK